MSHALPCDHGFCTQTPDCGRLQQTGPTPVENERQSPKPSRVSLQGIVQNPLREKHLETRQPAHAPAFAELRNAAVGIQK